MHYAIYIIILTDCKGVFFMPRTNQGKYVTEASKTFQEGDDFWKLGNYDEARSKYVKAAELYDKKDDPQGEAFVLSRLGELELSLDNFDKAEKSLKAAAELVSDLVDGSITHGDVLIRLSKVYAAAGDYDKALKTLYQAREVLSDTGSRDLLGEAYDQEAYIYMMQNREEEALKAYAKAAELFEADNVTLKEAAVLRAMARLEMKKRNYDRAHDLLEKCRDLYRENGDLLGEASALSAIGCLRYIIRDIANARKALMKSVYLYGKVEHHFAEAEALLYLARVEAFDSEKGDWERARMHYKKAIELFDFLQNDVMKNVVLNEYYDFLNRMAN